MSNATERLSEICTGNKRIHCGKETIKSASKRPISHPKLMEHKNTVHSKRNTNSLKHEQVLHSVENILLNLLDSIFVYIGKDKENIHLLLGGV